MKFVFTLSLAIGMLVSSLAFAAEPLAVSYGKHPKQSLNVYQAETPSSDQKLPVLIWVHGGGWRNGDKNNRSGINLCKTWAAAGMVAVGLDYRLTPDVVHPAHIEDVAAGIAWVNKNIAKYGGDPSKVFLLGHSAGAHLVALVATNPQYLKAHKLTPKEALAGVMPIDTASYDLTASQSFVVRKMIDDAFGKDREKLIGASPLLQAKQHRDDCPAFVIAVVKQRPEAVDESTALNAALPQSKLIVVDYPGSGQLAAHGMIAKELANFEKDMTKQLLAFVKGSTDATK